tara:strand:- start:2178 stop:2327 length:150 start_codon:yes stop_codon:yes gene_type:complete
VRGLEQIFKSDSTKIVQNRTNDVNILVGHYKKFKNKGISSYFDATPDKG